MPKEKNPQQISPELFTDEEWVIYAMAMQAAHEAQIPFMVGGAFALGVYTQRWRPTKDVDLLILPKDRDPMIDAITKAGFKDYYEQAHYDRGWIYRSTRDNYIVDVIWRMANRRADVDEWWFENACTVSVRGAEFKVVPPEELLWHKLYVLQRDRCDWPDVFNLLYAVGGKLDWK
ncbi:MAG: nucleotidyltransferase family protein [Limisphaerales bacterium]